MTEYWVSSAKHYCKICNCYMADNKMSRQHHENSVRHKINVDKLSKEKKNQKLQGARSERELQETLQQIEKAAREAMAADGIEKYAAPPPPPPRRNFDGHSSRPQQNVAAEETIPTEPDEENTGYYTIRGTTYLDGKVFSEKIQNGRECEVFVEELDDWFPGNILSRKQVQVPNTTIVLLTFEVQYTITFEDATEEVVQEVNVKCDRLRLIAKEDVDQDVFTLMAEEKQAAAPPPLPAPIDENTGISVWQTVSVNVVDEDEEYDAHQKVVEEMYKNNAQDENGGSFSKDKSSVEVPEYQPKTYKGIVIEDSLVQMDANNIEDFDDSDRDKVVAFKKRKIDEISSTKVEGGEETKSIFKPMKAKNFRKK